MIDLEKQIYTHNRRLRNLKIKIVDLKKRIRYNEFNRANPFVKQTRISAETTMFWIDSNLSSEIARLINRDFRMEETLLLEPKHIFHNSIYPYDLFNICFFVNMEKI